MAKKMFLPVILYIFIAGCALQKPKKAESSYLESWIGDYKFSESVPSLNGVTNIALFYGISICKENESYFARINVDGYQTLKRLKAKIEGDENSIRLIF